MVSRRPCGMASALKTRAIIFQGGTTHCETGQETLFHLLHMQNTDHMAEEACYFKLRSDTFICFLYLSNLVWPVNTSGKDTTNSTCCKQMQAFGIDLVTSAYFEVHCKY